MARLTIRIWVLIIFLVLALLMISPSFTKEVVIKSVERNSTAYIEGLRPGMIIKEINSNQIKTPEDYAQVLSEAFISENETRISI